MKARCGSKRLKRILTGLVVNLPHRLRVNLQGKVALVTGGTAGIGRAAALALARSGADVALIARDPQRALSTIREIERLGRRIVFQPADLASYDECRAAVDAAVEELGRLDIAVGSGGGGGHTPGQPFFEIDPALYPNYTRAHLFARLHVVRATLEHMIPGGGGSIVLVTTDAGRVPTPGESLIGAAAAGLIFLVRALGRELAHKHVRINAVSITLTRDTPGYEWFVARRQSDSVLVEALRKVEQRAVFGLNCPEDVADAVLFLASDAAGQVSGVTLSVNGGVSFPG